MKKMDDTSRFTPVYVTNMYLNITHFENKNIIRKSMQWFLIVIVYFTMRVAMPNGYAVSHRRQMTLAA